MEETKSLVAQIIRRGLEIPDKPAYIFLGSHSKRTVLTFDDVSHLSQKFAAKLRHLGTTSGDVVCNTLPTSPERIISQLGTILTGAVSMNGQICFADGSDFMRSLNDGRVKAVIYNPGKSKGAYEIIKAKSRITDGRVVCPDMPCLQMVIRCVLESSKGQEISLMEELRGTYEEVYTDNGPASVCAYMCTSGSTGIYKLLSFTSHLLAECGYEVASVNGLDSQSVLFNDRPFGWLGGVLSVTFALGCTRVTVDHSVPRGKGYSRFVREALRQEHCTHAITIPSLLESLVAEAERDRDENVFLLRSVAAIGAPTTMKVLKAIGTVAESLVIIYGSTESHLLAEMMSIRTFSVAGLSQGLSLKSSTQIWKMSPLAKPEKSLSENQHGANVTLTMTWGPMRLSFQMGGSD